MDLKTLLEHRSQTISEEGESESHVFIQGFFSLCVMALRDVPVEDKVEVVLIDTDLMCDYISLVVKEVFKEL